VADVSVRPARPGDAEEIARIQRETLAMAYEGVMPVEYFSQLADPAVRQELTQAIADTIRSDSPGHWALVAAEGDRLVGLCSFAMAVIEGISALEPADQDPDRTGFVEQILVEPRWGRRGHGSRLLAAATDLMREAGLARAVSWVPESNEATLTFLTSAGWARDGYARGLDTGSATLRELRLHTAF
jgi:GNAT superfamily N-acetyltransferase